VVKIISIKRNEKHLLTNTFFNIQLRVGIDLLTQPPPGCSEKYTSRKFR